MAWQCPDSVSVGQCYDCKYALWTTNYPGTNMSTQVTRVIFIHNHA